jgi:hypothetical protein
MAYIITNLINGALFFGFDSTTLMDRAHFHDDLGGDIRTYGLNNFHYQPIGSMSRVEAKNLYKKGTYGDVPNYMGWTVDQRGWLITATRAGRKVNIRIDTSGVEYAELSGTLSRDKVYWFKEYNRANRRGTSTRTFREKLKNSNSDEIALIVNGRWHKKTIKLPDDMGVTIKGDDLTFYYGNDIFFLTKNKTGIWQSHESR